MKARKNKEGYMGSASRVHRVKRGKGSFRRHAKHKTRAEMKEMTEMNKAFDDFDKACQKAIGACQDFIDMDINKIKL